jgi:peptide/nickel transport system ATP-binding protein
MLLSSVNESLPSGSALPTPGPLLSVRGLSIGFPTRTEAVAMAADGVSFDAYAGRTLGLVGESGCGKSVTLRALVGLVAYPGQVVGGSAMLDGQDLLALEEKEWEQVRGSRIAMIFQDPMSSLNPLFTIGDQLCEVLRLKRGLRSGEAREEAVGLLDRVGIRSPASRIRDYPHQLSGGMRQRVMIALAIAARPLVLLADEPTTALDVTVQDQILALIAELREELNMATILVSHDLAVVGQVCDEIAVMYAGRVVERGPLDEVLDHPRHPYTEGLAQAVAQLQGTHRNGRQRLKTLGGQPPSLSDLPPGCSFAPRCPYRRPECEQFDMHLDTVVHATACLVRQREVDQDASGAEVRG